MLTVTNLVTKNKIGKLRYNDITNLVDSINKNTISEIHAKENINALNELKKAEIKDKRLMSGQKELLSFFNDLLDTILTEIIIIIITMVIMMMIMMIMKKRMKK